MLMTIPVIIKLIAIIKRCFICTSTFYFVEKNSVPIQKPIIAPPYLLKETIPSQSMRVHLQCWIALLHALHQIVSPFYSSRIFPYIYIIFLSCYKLGKFFCSFFLISLYQKISILELDFYSILHMWQFLYKMSQPLGSLICDYESH